MRTASVRHAWEVTVLVLHDAPSSTIRVSLSWTLRSFAGRRMAFGVAALRAGWHTDVVLVGHAHLSSFCLAMPTARRWMVAHGIEVWRPLSAIRRRAIQSMEKIFAVSRFTQERMVAQGLARADVFRWWPDTLPTSAIPHQFFSREALHLPEGRMLLCVSRLMLGDAYKRIDLVIEALPRLRAQFPDLFLTIVGKGPDRPRLERLAREKGVAGSVHFAGFVDDARLPSYYAACEVFVLPSVEEGFGIVYLEAMAHAKPCVGARAGAIPEVIQNGETGWLSEPNDLTTLETSLLKLLDHPEEARRMGQSGKRRLETLFSAERFQSRVLEQFDVIETSAPGRAAA